MFKYSLIVGVLFLQSISFASSVSDCNEKFFASQFGPQVESYSRGEISLGELEKKVRGTTIKYTSIRTRGGKQLTESEVFTDKSDLIIGIDVTGYSKGHMYLIINGEARVDGRMFYAPTTIEREKWTLSDGLILRFRNLPEANRQKLLAWLNSSQVIKGPTCVAAGGKIIFDIGDLGVPERNYWFPATFLRFISQRGLVGADGTRLQPEVYLVNSDIRLFWNHLPHVWTVPKFIFRVLFDPYTWQGLKKK